MKGLRWHQTLLLALGTLSAMLLCVCLGSANIPLGDTVRILLGALRGEAQQGTLAGIILKVRLPRVLCVALMGASLSLCGAAMQGLLRNPLADGSTLGVASGASLGAAAAIVLGITLPGLPLSGTTLCAMGAAFASLWFILSLAWGLDRSLSTNTIILIGIIFSMFVSAWLNVMVTFAGERLRSITFWTMGSLAAASYTNALTLLIALILCGGALLAHAQTLNLFTLGEDQAAHLGVPVRRVKLLVMILVSVLIGVCVSIGGSIGFVGLVTPHIMRMLLGPNHRRLLPGSLFGGAIFMLLCDLAARTVLSPLELPVGVVTSIIGAAVFVAVFIRQRKGVG